MLRRSHRRQHRNEVFSAWAGLIGVVLFVVGSLVAGVAPKTDATTTDITDFLVQHRSVLLFGTSLILLSIPFLGCFIGLLIAMLREAEGGRAPLAGAAGLGWVLVLTIASIGILIQAALTWRGAAQADAATVRLVYDISSLSLYAVSATAVALSVGATSWIIWRTRWFLVGSRSSGSSSSWSTSASWSGWGAGADSNAAGYAAGVGPFLWALWVAVLAVRVGSPARSRWGS